MKITTCKDCRFYEPIDDTKGSCFGIEVSADMPIEECPTHSFEPKYANFLSGAGQDITPL